MELQDNHAGKVLYIGIGLSPLEGLKYQLRQRLAGQNADRNWPKPA